MEQYTLRQYMEKNPDAKLRDIVADMLYDEIVSLRIAPGAKLNVNQARELYSSGVISGGMIPKVDCCIEALNRGVESVIIMDGRVPHSILMEILTDEGAGTMVIGEDKND